MIASAPSLVALCQLIDALPASMFPPAPRRGRPRRYSDRLILKALVVMAIRHWPSVHALVSTLAEPTTEMAQGRALLSEDGCLPARRTWERRVQTLTAQLPALVAAVGATLLEQVAPWPPSAGPAVAVDSTAFHARGGVWHHKHREAGIVPHSSIDTEAHWTHSGWHGWVYGYKLHLVITTGHAWLPLAASVTPANVADNIAARPLLADLPATVRWVLGDVAYRDAALSDDCSATGRTLITPRRGRYPHTDPGVEVRRLFHKLRSATIESFNGQFKAIFDYRYTAPARGLRANQRLLLGAVVAYQLTVALRTARQQSARQGLAPFLRAAG